MPTDPTTNTEPTVPAGTPSRNAAGGSSSMDVGRDAERRLQQRYARPARRKPTKRSLLWVLVAGTLVASAFVIWILVAGSNRPATKDVGFELASASQITADFEVTKNPDDVVRCGVEALNQNYAVVGYTETTIGHVDPDLVVGRTSAHRVEIRTTNQANSAQVTQCWVID
ncbi:MULTISPECIES: DUF4307 domain-containing protein [Kocuria]|uniref:DUF4307 domain-containing protein n=1 Tax=Kocuria subflava TaxID=1736139 RepID=A0A846TRB0_9MICC|nr:MULTISPECIES: DUF4307 domain-containing protein [Kocuria]NKE09470.1 DUF4307 domain-containing protein [Kocuria subflava]